MKKSPLIVIFFVIFIDLLGFGIVIPILPYYGVYYGATPSQIGWLMMCYSGMQFLFAPFWGSLSDRIGRRPVILMSILGIGGSMFLLGWAPTLTWLFIARVLGGFFGANLSAAYAYIADVTPPDQRAKGMGMIGAAFGLGFLFGPALGGLLSKWGYGTAAYVAGGLALVNFIFALSVLKEPKCSQEERKEHRAKPNWQQRKKILTNPKTGVAILLFFIVTLGMAQLETTFGLFLLKRFGLDAFHAGLILALLALMMVIIQGGLIGRLVQALGETKLVLIGGLLMAIGLITASFSFYLSAFVAALMVQAVGYAIVNPSLSSLTSRNAQAGMQGATMGVYQSAGSLARVLGPISAGYIFEKIGIEVPFLAAAGLFVIAFILTLWRKNTWQTKEDLNTVSGDASYQET